MTDLPKHDLKVYLSKYKERFLYTLWQTDRLTFS